MDLGNGVSLNRVGKFCYPGYMLSVDGEQIQHNWPECVMQGESLENCQQS